MMVRKMDPFWKHVDRLNGGRFECHYCKQKFTGGVPRVKSHLSGIKGRGIDICTMVREDVQIAASEAINGSVPPKRLRTISWSGDEDDVTAEIKEKKDSSVLDDLLAKLVLVYGLDLGALQDGTLLDFVDALTKYGPGYKIPSGSIFRAKLIPSLTMKVEEYVTNVKKSWNKSGCTLISEICHDAKEKPFAAITACSREGAVFLASLEIPKDDSMSSCLEGLASSVIRYLGPENVVQYISCSSDNGQPSKSMQIDGRWVFTTRCAGNELQLLFEDIFYKVEWIQRTIDRATRVIVNIYKHNGILSLMRQYTNNRELKQPALNKISSNFDMLKSIVEVKNELFSLVSSPQWIPLVNENEETFKVAEIIQDGGFWEEVKEILLNFESLLQVVRLVDSEGLNFGYLYGAMKMAEASLKNLYNTRPGKYKRVWEIFVEKQGTIIHPVHAAAAFLNPAYMCSEKFREDTEVKESVNFLLEKFIIDEEREAFTAEMSIYRKKPPNLFNCTALTMMKTSHPCEWWDYCGDSVSILKKYASKILSQPCSTSSIKGCVNGSETVQTMLQWRSRPASVVKCSYLRSNALFMEKFSPMKAQVMKPVDLDSLDKLPEYTFSKDYFLDSIDQSVKLDPLSELKVSRSRSTVKSALQGKNLQLRFRTNILSPVVVSDVVKGEQGEAIEIVLVDSETSKVVQAGSEAMMKLTIVVLEGGFDQEASGNWTHDEFESNIKRSFLTGDLEVILNHGVGTVGDLTFLYNSTGTKSGNFRLGVKATTGYCHGIRICEGISNAFMVEDRNPGNNLSIGMDSQMNAATRIEQVSPAPAKDLTAVGSNFPHLPIISDEGLTHGNQPSQMEGTNQLVEDWLSDTRTATGMPSPNSSRNLLELFDEFATEGFNDGSYEPLLEEPEKLDLEL